MKRLSLSISLLTLLFTSGASAQQQESFDNFLANRNMIRNGVQAVLMCNGLFTSGRTLEQVIEQELAYFQRDRFRQTSGMVGRDEFLVDKDLKAVAVGGPKSGPVIRAAFREGIGCVVMAPDQTFDDIESLPTLDLAYPDFDPATTPWPNGDLVEKKPSESG